MARGERILHPHPAIVQDAFMARYSWTIWQYWGHPAWKLDELNAVLRGEAEGARERPAGGGGSGYSGDMRTAAEIASSGGLLPPPGGFQRTSGETP